MTYINYRYKYSCCLCRKRLQGEDRARALHTHARDAYFTCHKCDSLPGEELYKLWVAHQERIRNHDRIQNS